MDSPTYALLIFGITYSTKVISRINTNSQSAEVPLNIRFAVVLFFSLYAFLSKVSVADKKLDGFGVKSSSSFSTKLFQRF